MQIDIHKQTIGSVLVGLEKLVKENVDLIRRAERANQGIQLLRYQLKELIEEIEDYQRLKKEEREFKEFGSKLDRFLAEAEDVELLSREEMGNLIGGEEMRQIVINNHFSPINTNTNTNENHNE